MENIYSQEQEDVRYPGAVNANLNTAAAETQMDKFNAAQGHGFAAEQANHLYDVLTGKDAVIIGGDNAKNGADRLVNGIKIQTKYCQDAAASVSAAFEQGQYRYINADGSLMQLEVPSDQYEKAVELMAKRIESGQVQGITNPAEAKNIVRKGHFTYKQAANIVKAGTIESLTFDAVNGAIISTSAFGITAVLTFAQSLWNGDTPDIATEKAAYSGLQIGGAAFMNSVITAQLMRTGLNKALVAPTDAIIKLLGPKTSAYIANSLRSGANIYGAAAMNNVAKLLRGNMVTSMVMTVILSARDISNAFRGRISGKQLFKNITTTAGGIGGGTVGIIAGKFVLNLVAPGAGTVAGVVISLAGATAGGTAGSAVTNAVVGQFIEDDAVALVKLIESSFCQQAQDYMLTQEEIDIVLEDLSNALAGETLLDMFASPDHKAFADALVQSQIERLIGFRCNISLPTEDKFIQGIGRLVEHAQDGTGIFAAGASAQVDPVEIGQQLTGQEYSLHAAQKALYASKQMNSVQVAVEGRLKKTASDEKKSQGELKTIYQERDAINVRRSTRMGAGLKIVDPSVLSETERTELDANIDSLIAAHKNNRQAINRLVFESVAAMTTGEDYERQLANKKGLRRFLGGITGSNKKLQDKINSSRAAAQYASQQTLQRLAEQNLMSFDLITAVNNKLNASVIAVESEINQIYAALATFFKQNRSDMIQLENRVERLERNVSLLNWQNSIEYQMFDEIEYSDLDDASKIVCVVRDFYDITKGEWTTSDLLLLKAAMGQIGIQPKEKLKYFDFIKSVFYNSHLRKRLLNGESISYLPEPYLIPLSGLKKLEQLDNEERYIVDTLMGTLADNGIAVQSTAISEDLTRKFLERENQVNVDVLISNYDLVLELLFNLKQAEAKVTYGGESDAGPKDELPAQSPPELPGNEPAENQVSYSDTVFAAKRILDFVETEHYYFYRYTPNSGVCISKGTGKKKTLSNIFKETGEDSKIIVMDSFSDIVLFSQSPQSSQSPNLPSYLYRPSSAVQNGIVRYVIPEGKKMDPILTKSIVPQILCASDQHIIYINGKNDVAREIYIYTLQSRKTKKYSLPFEAEYFYPAADITPDGQLYLIGGSNDETQLIFMTLDAVTGSEKIKKSIDSNLYKKGSHHQSIKIDTLRVIGKSLYCCNKSDKGSQCIHNPRRINLLDGSVDVVLPQNREIFDPMIYADWIIYFAKAYNEDTDYGIEGYNLKSHEIVSFVANNADPTHPFFRADKWIYFWSAHKDMYYKFNLEQPGRIENLTK